MRVVRPETPEDYTGIRAINQLAFQSDVEADLVDRVRRDGTVIASLVAEEDERIVGHILLSRLPIQTAAGQVPAAALGPMAVRPEYQRRGIGGDLIRAGLMACKSAGMAAVIVLGHPEYYPRFGFSAHLARRISSPYSGHGAAWMAIELKPAVLSDHTGSVTYPDAWSDNAHS